MKKTSLLIALIISASATLAFAAHDHTDATKSVAPAPPDAAWLAQAKADYPLTNCVVSDEKIGGAMGDGIDYVYKQEGKPDRLVRFCCKDCVKDFNKDPAKFLAEIDAAADAKKNKK